MSEDINVGAISEALNNKVDLNQMNTNAQGLSYASGWGMPSDRYIDLTLGASGTSYTAPANGWVIFTGQGIGFVGLEQKRITVFNPYADSGDYHSVLIPVTKGTFKAYYNGITNKGFKFIYAEGEQ